MPREGLPGRLVRTVRVPRDPRLGAGSADSGLGTELRRGAGALADLANQVYQISTIHRRGQKATAHIRRQHSVVREVTRD